MEKRVFLTSWKRNQKFADDQYQIGKIVGIAMGMDIIKGKNGIPYGIGVTDKVRDIKVYCTKEDYARFKKLVDEYVLFNCIFDEN